MPPLTQANHAIRARNVTASECAALMGHHPYKTAGQVWDRLNGLLPERSPSLAMEFGSLAEPILAKFAARQLNMRLRMNSQTIEHPRVRLCATPDAIVVGERALIEFKTSWSKYRWEHGLPPDVEWQARAQMACTHRELVIVYVFSGEVRIFNVRRNRGLERKLTQAVERFWNEHMVTGIRPVDAPRPSPTTKYEGKRK